MTVKSAASRQALGRGLKALIPTNEAGNKNIGVSKIDSNHIFQIAIEKILPQPNQPRADIDQQALEELASSIKEHGILQPIIVRKKGDDYEIVAGERRWRAANKLGFKNVPTVVKELSDSQSFEIALIENIQRSDLTPIEEAQAYKRLLEEFAMTQEEVAKRVGKDRSTVTNILRLLQLPDTILPHVGQGKLSAGHARAILAVKNPDMQVKLSQEILTKQLSVRQAEKLAKSFNTKKTTKPIKNITRSSKSTSSAQRDLIEKLQRALGTKVDLVHNNGKGTLEINFFSYAELDRIIDLLISIDTKH